jgi:group I intron endonuclease
MGYIYKISNSIDDRVYIGSTIYLNERWLEHKRKLLKDKHENIHLQRFVNKYGLECLSFDIIEEVNNDVVLVREQYYLDNIINKFNIAVSSSAPMMNKHHTKESIEKIAIHSRGVNNPMYGKNHTETTKDKMRGTNNGMYGKEPANKGKSRSKETIEKIRQGTLQGMHKPENWEKFITNNKKGKEKLKRSRQNIT